ncbi:MAG: hypothetical protein EOP83_09620 [Verrucomicrobiaceae bacterium]|nr:MAG: hypothetical protein EOP83_09620 [Verrucomicrobiaceae bacterium]
MATPKIYKGFSTQEAERTRRWTRYDVDLIKRDLLNHFQTRIGERVLRPEFGCRIWDYLNEPLTPALRQDIITETVRVCSADPRIIVHSVNVFDFPNGLRIEITLDFVGIAVEQTFRVDFEDRQSGSLV